MTNTHETPAPEYGPRARLRVALALAAADLADHAAAIVPTDTDRAGHSGEMLACVAQLASAAQEMLALAIAYERRRGASWEGIGEALGVSKQAAHSRYAADVAAYDHALLMAWLTGDAHYPGVPAGAIDAAASALDRWLSDRRPRRGRTPDQVPSVTAGLAQLSITDEARLLIEAAAVLAERDPDRTPARTHALRVAHCRRMIAHLERSRAAGTLSNEDAAAALIATKRTQLAALEATPPS
jgi:hypothetical protein